MASYTKMTVGKENRTELHEKLALTGAEISLNTLPAGANVPFVHSHKANLANVFVKSFFIDFPIFFWKKGALN